MFIIMYKRVGLILFDKGTGKKVVESFNFLYIILASKIAIYLLLNDLVI